MRKITKWILAFVGTLLMAWLGNYFYDSTKNVPILKLVTGAFNWLYDSGLGVLNYELKVWVVLAFLVSIALLLAAYAAIAVKSIAEPDFVKYKKDVLKNWIWRWDWKPGDNGWKIVNLTPYCPKDDVQLLDQGSWGEIKFYCAKCGSRYQENYEPVERYADTEILILDKVNKKTFRIE